MASDANLSETPKMPRSRGTRAAMGLRNDLTQFFQTPEGEVPWQNEMTLDLHLLIVLDTLAFKIV